MPKVLVSLPDDLIAKLDEASGKRGRSAEIVRRLEQSFGEDGVALSVAAHPVGPKRYGSIRETALVNVPRTGRKAVRESPKVAAAALQVGPVTPAFGSRLKKR